MRFVGERKALAAAVLAFFSMLYLLNAIVGPPELTPLFWGLSSAYLLGFFGLVAGWFWSRWYVMGLGFSGLTMAAMLGFQIGLDPIVLFFGGTHSVALLSLVGKGPSSAFDGRKDWRERFRMDENAANRLGKAIMRAGASLPYLIMAGLAPKQGVGQIFAVLAMLLGAAGLVGLVRLRTWGALAIAGAAVASAATLLAPGPAAAWQAPVPTSYLALPLLVLALWPLAPALIAGLRGRTGG